MARREGAAAVVESVPLCRRAARVGEVIGPVVGGKLERAQAQAVEIAKDAEVAVQIEASFEIHEGRDLSRLADALDVRGVEGELDLGPVLCQLVVRVDETQDLLRFETRGVVLLRHEQRKERRVEPSLFRAGEIELTVLDALAHVATVVKLPIHHVNMGIEDERVLVERPRAV